MNDRQQDRLALIAFMAALVVLATLYGIFAARWNWFPVPQIGRAEATLRDLSANWKNDVGLEPTRHLVPARQTGRGADDIGFTMHAPGRAAPGYTLVAGLSPEQDTSFHAVTLYDVSGQQLHRWPVHYDRLDADGPDPENVTLHGMEVFEDGSIVATFDGGNAIARIDPCGNPVWTTMGGFHHSITRDGSGRLWSWRGDEIVQIDEDSGEVLGSLNLRTDVMQAGDDQTGVIGIRTLTEEKDTLAFEGDPFHANDVEPLLPMIADAFPLFEAGDLLISLREINLVAVIEPVEGRLRWYRHGPWHRQHDPDFQPDGTITVFDNATGSGRSRILTTDPVSGQVSELYAPNTPTDFFTWRRGKHQILSNGNILISEPERGRVFEVGPDAALIWEREMFWDADRNLIVTEARHVPPDFFSKGSPTCRSATLE